MRSPGLNGLETPLGGLLQPLNLQNGWKANAQDNFLLVSVPTKLFFS